MEDDKLKSLFSSFKPELPSDLKFMAELERRLNSVEIIRQHAIEVRARNKKAVIIAAFAGFIVGCLLSFLMPGVTQAVKNWQLSFPDESVININSTYFIILAWLIIGSISVISALNFYEIAYSWLDRKNSGQHS